MEQELQLKKQINEQTEHIANLESVNQGTANEK